MKIPVKVYEEVKTIWKTMDKALIWQNRDNVEFIEGRIYVITVV